jgi:hypothetical protein
MDLQHLVELDQNKLVGRLVRLGWAVAKELVTPENIARVLEKYQEYHGLTSNVSAIARHLEEPRFCALPEVAEARGQVCKWPHKDVTWTVIAGLRRVADADLVAAYAEAWARWARVCGVRPVYRSNDRTVNVLMGARNIDGSMGVLAESQLPCGVGSNGQLQQWYDTGEAWVISDTPGQREIDLIRVACHEIGHVIGLDHIPPSLGVALLNPTYSRNIKGPTGLDVQEARSRYGDPDIAQPPTPNPDSEFTIKVRGSVTSVEIPGYRVTKLLTS